MIFATRCAKSRTLAAAGPSLPLRDRGSPTTTSIGSYSPTMAANRRSAASTSRPGTVSTGVARIPSGSHEATPIRASPTSTAIRRPFLMPPSCLLGHEPLDGLDRGLDGAGVLAAALGDVVLAATSAAEGLGGGADEFAGLDAALAGGLVGGDHGQRAVVGDREQGHDGGPAAADALADVE